MSYGAGVPTAGPCRLQHHGTLGQALSAPPRYVKEYNATPETTTREAFLALPCQTSFPDANSNSINAPTKAVNTAPRNLCYRYTLSVSLTP